jgi:heat shock protein HslJ
MKYLAALTSILALLSCGATKNTGNQKAADQTQAVLAEGLQQKQADGIDFYAKGSLPSSWSVEIDFDKIIRFKSLDGADVLSTPVKAVENTANNSVSYTTKAGNGEMVIQLFKEPCTDPLSGEKFNQKVTVDVNGKHYEGCGQYLSDAALNGKWILEKVGAKEVTAAEFAKGLPEINFDLSGGSITGHDGCNRITGAMQVQGNRIKFAAIAGTKMACPGNKPINDFVVKLSNAFATYYFKDGRLFLYLIDDSTVVFKKG